jgi:hypothetical protein
MKLLNIFKIENKKSVAPVAQKLDKNKLGKVIGGGGSDIPNEVEVAVRSRSNIRTQ